MPTDQVERPPAERLPAEGPPAGRPPAEGLLAPSGRVAAELAIARLDLRQISLVALYDALDGADRQRHGHEHRVAEAAALGALRVAARDDRSPAEVARAFFGLYYVFPNLGLVGPFYDGDVGALKEVTWLSAYDAIRSGVSVRAEFHARLWEDVCDDDRRARAAGLYVRDRSLDSVPPSASRLAVERHRRRIDALLTGSECVPALLAQWAIESHPRRLDELASAEVRHKHGLLEQRHMAVLLGMRPNTLAQSLRRLRARLGEEMRVLWDIERTGGLGPTGDPDDDR